MSIMDVFFQRKHSEVKEPYLTETVVFGMHMYRSPGEDSSVFFVDESRRIRKMLVDREGRIQNFPGIVKEKFWVEEVGANALKPQIRFRTEFDKRGDKWIFRWQIQPDGRYWADDDGFGMEHDLEVILYTYVDRNGDYTGPFRIYSLGSRDYTLDRYEAALEMRYPKDLQRLKDGCLKTTYIQNPEDLLFPRLKGRWDRDNSYFLRGKEEALAYWNHPVLRQNLREAVQILLGLDKPIGEIASDGHQRDIQASMTLFYRITGEEMFKQVLDKFFEGKQEPYTLEKLQ